MNNKTKKIDKVFSCILVGMAAIIFLFSIGLFIMWFFSLFRLFGLDSDGIDTVGERLFMSIIITIGTLYGISFSGLILAYSGQINNENKKNRIRE